MTESAGTGGLYFNALVIGNTGFYLYTYYRTMPPASIRRPTGFYPSTFIRVGKFPFERLLRV